MMSMKLDKRTRQIVDVVEKWMEDHNISVKNDERTNKILHDNDLSWHWHIFSNFSTERKLNILEIGTHNGKFANFLSNIFPFSKIFTIDLEKMILYLSIPIIEMIKN